MGGSHWAAHAALPSVARLLGRRASGSTRCGAVGSLRADSRALNPVAQADLSRN